MKLNQENFEQKRKNTLLKNMLYKGLIALGLTLLAVVIVIAIFKLNGFSLQETYPIVIFIAVLILATIIARMSTTLLPEIRQNREFNNYISQNIIIPSLENIGFSSIETNLERFSDNSLIVRKINDDIIAESNISGRYKNKYFEFQNISLRRVVLDSLLANIALEQNPLDSNQYIKNKVIKGNCIVLECDSKISSNIIIYSKKTNLKPKRKNYTKTSIDDKYFTENYNIYLEDPSKITEYIKSGLFEKIRKLEDILKDETLYENRYIIGYKGLTICIIDNKLFIGIETYKLLFKVYFNNKEETEVYEQIEKDSGLLKSILDIFIDDSN